MRDKHFPKSVCGVVYEGWERRTGCQFSFVCDGSIRRQYGIKKTWGLIPGRVSLLIDRDGLIRAIHESQFRPASHVPAMLAALDQVQAQRSLAEQS